MLAKSEHDIRFIDK